MLLGFVLSASVGGCASAHHRHSSHGKHKYYSSHGHSGTHHSYHHTYTAPKPQYPPGSYMLPGGLQSVCTGGTPPPCQ
jgi:hypothetical protein